MDELELYAGFMVGNKELTMTANANRNRVGEIAEKSERNVEE